MGEPEAAAPELTGEVVSEHSWSTDTLSLVSRQTYHLQLQIYRISARTNWLLDSVMERLSALEDRGLGRSVLQLLEVHQSSAGCR